MLTIKIPERRRWRRSGVFIVNFEHISDLNFEHAIVGWESISHRKVEIIRRLSFVSHHHFKLFANDLIELSLPKQIFATLFNALTTNYFLHVYIFVLVCRFIHLFIPSKMSKNNLTDFFFFNVLHGLLTISLKCCEHLSKPGTLTSICYENTAYR